MELFGWTIESPKARREREREEFRRMVLRHKTDPALAQMLRELRDANRTIARELRKTREAMLCPSVYVTEGLPAVRCVLQRGHIQDHMGNGQTWTDAETVAEVAS